MILRRDGDGFAKALLGLLVFPCAKLDDAAVGKQIEVVWRKLERLVIELLRLCIFVALESLLRLLGKWLYILGQATDTA